MLILHSVIRNGSIEKEPVAQLNLAPGVTKEQIEDILRAGPWVLESETSSDVPATEQSVGEPEAQSPAKTGKKGKQ